MNKQDLISKIKTLDEISPDEKSYLINLVNTNKKYGLVWEEKPEDVESQLQTLLPILSEVNENALISDNDTAPNHILVEGDNLHVLTALTFTHEGKVDVIYIDPPYNTGTKDNGKTDFKYNDDYVDKEDSFRHSKWLSFMHRRLVLAKRLLTTEGFIAVSIDDNEYAQLCMLLKDIFTENVKTICVKMSEASGLKMSSVKRLGTIPKYKEYLLLAKPSGINNFFFDYLKKEEWDAEYNIYLENLSEEQRLYFDEISEKEQVTEDEIQQLDHIASGIKLRSVAQVLRELGITANKEKDAWCFANSWRICQCASSSSVLRLANAKKEFNTNEVFFVQSARDKILYLVRSTYNPLSSKPRVQLIFADNNLTFHPGDLWTDIKTTGIDAEGGVKFKNGKKPIKLLNKILKANNKKDSIILDFFAGSGSTLHSVMELNASDGGSRTGIIVTNNENNICQETTYPRIKNVLQDFPSNNLRYFKTGFVGRDKTLANKRELTIRATELLSIKENCYNNITLDYASESVDWLVIFGDVYSQFAVIYDDLKIEEAIVILKKVIANKPNDNMLKVYVFSNGQYAYAEDFEDIINDIELCSLPDVIYKAYLNVLPTKNIHPIQLDSNTDENEEELPYIVE